MADARARASAVPRIRSTAWSIHALRASSTVGVASGAAPESPAIPGSTGACAGGAAASGGAPTCARSAASARFIISSSASTDAWPFPNDQYSRRSYIPPSLYAKMCCGETIWDPIEKRDRS